MKQEDNSVSHTEFLEIIEKKISDQDFLGDIEGVLRPELSYKIVEGYEFIKIELSKRI